jgi:hypothetical protein
MTTPTPTHLAAAARLIQATSAGSHQEIEKTLRELSKQLIAQDVEAGLDPAESAEIRGRIEVEMAKVMAEILADFSGRGAAIWAAHTSEAEMVAFADLVENPTFKLLQARQVGVGEETGAMANGLMMKVIPKIMAAILEIQDPDGAATAALLRGEGGLIKKADGDGYFLYPKLSKPEGIN